MAECHLSIPEVLSMTSSDLRAWESKFSAFFEAREKALKARKQEG